MWRKCGVAAASGEQIMVPRTSLLASKFLLDGGRLRFVESEFWFLVSDAQQCCGTSELEGRLTDCRYKLETLAGDTDDTSTGGEYRL